MKRSTKTPPKPVESPKTIEFPEINDVDDVFDSPKIDSTITDSQKQATNESAEKAPDKTEKVNLKYFS